MNECPFCKREKGVSNTCVYCKGYKDMKDNLKMKDKLKKIKKN
jgi:hypothetical protein